jgi:hypothetical protein
VISTMFGVENLKWEKCVSVTQYFTRYILRWSVVYLTNGVLINFQPKHQKAILIFSK